jgi:DnaJ domain
MADASSTLAGLAPRDVIPRFRSASPLQALGLGPDEGFVLSRVDGVTRLGDIINLVPFEVERTVEILRRLWIAGAIEIPGHEPPVMSESKGAAASGASSTAVPKLVITALPPGLELTLEQAQYIDAFFGEMSTKNAFELLGLQRGADKKDVKRAYFKLSKDFHPDRFYGKKLGGYAERLTQIFNAIKSAFDLLSDDERRAAYEDSVFG